MIITENKKIIEPGDVIVCQGMRITVGEKIYYNGYWKEFDGSDNHYCEFLDTKGGYHYWKQELDGGYVIPKEKSRYSTVTGDLKMTNADKMRIISATYHKLNDADSIDDLHKLKLTLAEFDICRAIFPEVSKIGGVAKTSCTEVANFFKRNGYSVELKGVNYTITI